MQSHNYGRLFRSLTSSSGVTNTWRKDSRRKLKRFVFCLCTSLHYLPVFCCLFFLNGIKTLKRSCMKPADLKWRPFSLLAAAAVPQRLHRVWAEQAGHADWDSVGQQRHLCLHPEQPLQWEPGERRYMDPELTDLVGCVLVVELIPSPGRSSRCREQEQNQSLSFFRNNLTFLTKC